MHRRKRTQEGIGTNASDQFTGAGLSSLAAAGLAAVAFLAAVLLYVACRTFLPSEWPRLFSCDCEIGRLGDVFPSFAHSYAFAIWLALTMRRKPDYVMRLIFAFAIVESALELAQLGVPPVAPRPTGDLALILSYDAARLLSAGTFDIWDIAAIWSGMLAATVTLGIHPVTVCGRTRTLSIRFMGTERRPPAPPPRALGRFQLPLEQRSESFRNQPL